MRLIPTNSSHMTGVAYEPGSTKFYLLFGASSCYEYDGGQDVDHHILHILFDPESQGSAARSETSMLPYRKLEQYEVDALGLKI